MNIMGLVEKIQHRAHTFYRQKIVCEQYPMLTPINRKEWQKQGAIGVVYMLHHIAQKNSKGIPTNEDLIVSPDFLEAIIIKYKKKGFEFISLDQLNEIISSTKKTEAPFIAFTIDDGYLDNYTNALPVFIRHQVPFTIFIASDFINKKAILWWDILERLVLNNESIIINNKIYPCRIFQEKWDTFRIIRESILRLDQTNLEAELAKMFSYYKIDWYEPICHQAMSWQQVKKISQHPLCTIGGHTVSHLALNQLNEETLYNEIAENIAKLQEVIGESIHHFAYPYGSPNEIGGREFQLIKTFNLKTAFTAYGGCITESNKTNITHLPRVYLHE